MSKTQASVRSPKAKSASVSGSDVTTTLATAVDITGTAIAALANKKYRIVGSLFIGCNNTGGIRFTINAPSGSAILTCVLTGSSTSATAVQNIRLTTIGTLTGSSIGFNRFNGTSGMVSIIGYITTGANAGNITLQFASANAGETSTIFIGSSIDLIEVI